MAQLSIDKDLKSTDPFAVWLPAGTSKTFSESTFKRMIAVERKRTERSGEPFLLMLLQTGNHQSQEKNEKALDIVLSFLPSSIRETDVIGWYKDRTTVGVMFTGLACNDKSSILSEIGRAHV